MCLGGEGRASEEHALDEGLLGGGGGGAGGGDEGGLEGGEADFVDEDAAAFPAAGTPGDEFAGGDHAPDGGGGVVEGGGGVCDADAARGFEGAVVMVGGHGVIVA